MNFNSFLSAGLIGASVVVVGAQFAPASAISLYQTTNNTGYTDLQNSVSVDFRDTGTGIVFDIKNIGPTVFSITEVYFGKLAEFSSLLSYASIDNTSGDTVLGGGVQYSKDASPPNPGGSIAWDAAFSADPDARGGGGGFRKNGIDTGEYLSIAFNYINGASFQDVVDGYANGDLTFAMHIQSVGGSGGGSEWIASREDIDSVPEPITLLGTGAALSFGAMFQKRRSQLRKQNA